MSLAHPSILLLAGALASPTLFDALRGEMHVRDAALRFLICVPVAAIMLALLTSLSRAYRPSRPARRATDQPAIDGPVEGGPAS